MEVEKWAEKGRMVSVLNKEVFVIDEGKGEKTLVILHGYGNSSIDYYKILPELSKHYRVIIQDFIGFGFSDKPTAYHFNILEQADVTLELWCLLELKNITLLGHNYGTHIALEILARQKNSLTKIDFRNLVFLNSTISFDHTDISEEMKNPLQEFSKKTLLMLTSFSFYKMKIKDLFFDDDKISEKDIKAKWILMEHKNGREILNFLPNYSTETKLLWNRWFNTIKQNTIPAKIISGKKDIIFDENEAIQFSKELKESKLHFIDNCGHYAMLEKPEELIKLILNS
jgi:pimeloyl-ACP methyl ester carboxylesterase